MAAVKTKFKIESQELNGSWVHADFAASKTAAMKLAKKIEAQGWRARIIEDKPYVPIEYPSIISEFQISIICTQCGCKGGAHNRTTGMCPPTVGYGQKLPDPSDNWELTNEQLSAAYDRYWQQSTFFTPRR